ncbi:MAG: dTDP-4-dehydrorhamnose 3,5-epimerase family protein, partial [Trichodesmium sp. St16_bin2-tuft]|nr:dTDP-4-dehydrorhamnose 3,5-epimerase family protein [Trichodesmium sp. St16_bin2-tuft]
AADVLYKTTDYYAAEYERSILWNDPEIGINWPLDSIEVKLSQKDKVAKTLKDADLFL